MYRETWYLTLQVSPVAPRFEKIDLMAFDMTSWLSDHIMHMEMKLPDKVKDARYLRQQR